MNQPLFDKRQVADSFGRAAATYDQAAAFQRRVGHNLLARLPALKLLVTTGPFNAAIDVAAAHRLDGQSQDPDGGDDRLQGLPRRPEAGRQ